MQLIDIDATQVKSPLGDFQKILAKISYEDASVFVETEVIENFLELSTKALQIVDFEVSQNPEILQPVNQADNGLKDYDIPGED